MKRLDLAEVVLTLKASGVDDIAAFPLAGAARSAGLGTRRTIARRSRSDFFSGERTGLACGLRRLAATLLPNYLKVPATAPIQRSRQAHSRHHSLGRRMLAFPVHPRYARMLLAAQEYRCVPSIALIAALTQGRNLLRRLEGKQAREDREDVLGGDTDSDFFILMRAFRYRGKEPVRFPALRAARDQPGRGARSGTIKRAISRHRPRRRLGFAEHAR